MFTKPTMLVLEDGAVFTGESFGSLPPAIGEVVFSTAMTGYQEMLTDPSFAGQIVVPTYPLIGNYGINSRDYESQRARVAGFAIREQSTRPSHSLSNTTLSDFLADQAIPGIHGLDTRALTRKLRSSGVMMGMITDSHSPDSAVTAIKNHRPYGSTDFVSEVTTAVPYRWSGPLPGSKLPSRQRTILVDDYGLKYNILRSLSARGCVVTAMPANSSAQDFISRNPDGIVLSPGPGDPARLAGAISTAKELVGKIPILGICLGSQVIAHAFGGTTFKLKFGHRGSNHPVKDVRTDKVYITSQNHGYAVDPNSLPASLIVSHVNLNDGTVEGLRHASMPVMGIQYHSEASPGPLDSGYIFDDFLEMIDASS